MHNNEKNNVVHHTLPALIKSKLTKSKTLLFSVICFFFYKFGYNLEV